uniref:Uncharacterized protein n=1 Tax=Clytia hemisphaerica TaxID=252671 RepID=A0A7M6DNI5_9CNID|eukprot:TCONS_00017284-protein
MKKTKTAFLTNLISIFLTLRHCSYVNSTSPAPLCFLRAGREIIFRFKRPSNVLASQSKDIFLQWTNINGKVTETKSCFYSTKVDQFFCPTPLSVYDKDLLKQRISSLKAVDRSKKVTVLTHPQAFVPSQHLFDCISNHDARDIRFKESDTNKWVLSWRKSSLSKCFNPSYEVTVTGSNQASPIITTKITKCKQPNGRCEITLPDDVRKDGTLKTVCITSIFSLTLKNYYTITTKRSELCTVSEFSSKYRLKVVNTKTGKVVEDYGIWHHPLGGDNLNKTTLQEIKKTKQKVMTNWKFLKNAKQPQNSR